MNTIFHPVEKSPSDKVEDNNPFYDEGTLKQQDFYPWAEMVPEGQKEWNENCQNCRRATQKIFIRPDTHLIGVVDSVLGITKDPKQHPLAYKQWKDDPVMDRGECGSFWYCSECRSIWTVYKNSFYTKVMIMGQFEFETERIKLLDGGIQVMPEPEIDPGEKTSEDATMCFRCLVWRVVKPYSDTHVQHVCPKCETVQLVKIEESKAQGE